MAKPNKIEEAGVVSSSGNVFADIGIKNPEAALAKAQLARQIVNLIQQKGLTQNQAAELLGVDQPKVSALVRGSLSGFSSDRLFRFLNALGQNVIITIEPADDAAITRVA